MAFDVRRVRRVRSPAKESRQAIAPAALDAVGFVFFRRYGFLPFDQSRDDPRADVQVGSRVRGRLQNQVQMNSPIEPFDFPLAFRPRLERRLRDQRRGRRCF